MSDLQLLYIVTVVLALISMVGHSWGMSDSTSYLFMGCTIAAAILAASSAIADIGFRLDEIGEKMKS